MVGVLATLERSQADRAENGEAVQSEVGPSLLSLTRLHDIHRIGSLARAESKSMQR